MGNAAWRWFAGAPNPGHDGGAAGERDNDEYQADLTLPAPGAYDYAWRFTVDGGFTWTYCDGGDPGSSNGYAPGDAGQLTSVADPCAPNPCVGAPPPACDGDTVVSYVDLGVCAVEGGAAACTFDELDRTACGAGEVCQAGACVDVGGVCDPNPCDTPPAARCDGNAVLRFGPVRRRGRQPAVRLRAAADALRGRRDLRERGLRAGAGSLRAEPL